MLKRLKQKRYWLTFAVLIFIFYYFVYPIYYFNKHIDVAGVQLLSKTDEVDRTQMGLIEGEMEGFSTLENPELTLMYPFRGFFSNRLTGITMDGQSRSDYAIFGVHVGDLREQVNQILEDYGFSGKYSSVYLNKGIFTAEVHFKNGIVDRISVEVHDPQSIIILLFIILVVMGLRSIFLVSNPVRKERSD